MAERPRVLLWRCVKLDGNPLITERQCDVNHERASEAQRATRIRSTSFGHDFTEQRRIEAACALVWLSPCIGCPGVSALARRRRDGPVDAAALAGPRSPGTGAAHGEHEEAAGRARGVAGREGAPAVRPARRWRRRGEGLPGAGREAGIDLPAYVDRRAVRGGPAGGVRAEGVPGARGRVQGGDDAGRAGAVSDRRHHVRAFEPGPAALPAEARRKAKGRRRRRSRRTSPSSPRRPSARSRRSCTTHCWASGPRRRRWRCPWWRRSRRRTTARRCT